MRFALAAVFWLGWLAILPAADWYVATNGTGEGTNWADATNSIQGAIDASSAGDTVLVSNGVYETGGVTNYPSGYALTNRIVINKAITVRSANNDPANTIIKGAWDPATNGPAAVRCVYMANGSTLIGFTLTNGATLALITDDGYGGGVYCQSTATIISNCVLAGNAAQRRSGGAYYGTLYNCSLIRNSVLDTSGGGGGSLWGILYNCTLSGNSAASGGGAYGATLYNCTIVSNSTSSQGGGAYAGTLYNCTLVGNSAYDGGGALGATLYNCTLVGNQSGSQGGGAYDSTLYNSIIYFNTAGAGSNYSAASFTNSCTIPAQGGWAAGNITNDPLFITNGSGYGTNHVAGNYRLSANSPCLNAGTNFPWMTDPADVRSRDLDGQPRIRDQIVDMGAYETLLKGTIFYIH